MVSFLEALLLGFAQGLTEWIPVSSSGHLALIQMYLGLNVPILFDILLHVATLLVLFIFFRREIFEILKAFFKWDIKSSYFRLGVFIIIGTIGTGIIALLFKDLFESYFTNKTAVGVSLIITGAILLATKFFNDANLKLNWWKSFAIGIMQGFALIPGISRSGATISVGKFLGLSGEDSARFSFLLVIPAILGAFVLDFGDISLLNGSLFPIIFGMIISFIVGYITLKWLVKIIKAKKFWWFSVYCFVVGVIVLVV